MSTRSLPLFLLLFALAAIRLDRTAAGDPDPTRDWPRPELRPGRSDPELAAAIGAHAQALHDAGHFSGVILAAKAGTLVMARAYGRASVEAGTPNTIDTAFNIGSLNKLFTKLAIAQLAEAGKLSLEDTIARHLPGGKLAGADRITIRQLLDHRSGMGDIFGPRYEAAPPARLRELADFVPLFAGESLAFEPGAEQRYSNAGYIVLGLIVERLSGERYRDYVARRIFAPAGMARSGFWAIDERIAYRATGYTRHGDGQELAERVPNARTLPGRPSSAGGAFATAGDLLRFFTALHGNKLASARWTNWMVNGSFDDARREPTISVGGGAPGVNAAVELDGAWTVIALANYDPPSAAAAARGAMEIVRGRPMERPAGPMIRQGPPPGPERTELAGEVAAPAQLAGHLFTVEARLNGKGPFRFAIDSGSAGMLRISSAAQQALGLTAIGEVMSGDPSGKNPQRRPVVRVETVELGGARFFGVEATVSERAGDDGVIGLALFAGLTATLDYPRLQLRLDRRPVAATDPHAVAFAIEHGIPVIELDAGGVPLRVDVDTGSPAALSIPAAWSGKLAFASAPRVVGKGRTVSNELEIRGAELRGELRVAGFAQPSPRIDMNDVFPVANLGARFLGQYAVTFDLANKRMALAR